MLKRKTPLRSRKRLNPVSRSRKIKNKDYEKAKAAYLKDHPVCEFIGCTSPSQDLHHKCGRGNKLSDPDYFMAVCRKHHNYIHEHVAESREKGYLVYGPERFG